MKRATLMCFKLRHVAQVAVMFIDENDGRRDGRVHCARWLRRDVRTHDVSDPLPTTAATLNVSLLLSRPTMPNDTPCISAGDVMRSRIK